MTNDKENFRVWIKKSISGGCPEYMEQISAMIEDLKGKYRFYDGTLDHAPAWVFEFPDAETAYNWQYTGPIELELRYGEKNARSAYYFYSFEDNFNNWECYKNEFIRDPKNKDTAYYKLWTEKETSAAE